MLSRRAAIQLALSSASAALLAACGAAATPAAPTAAPKPTVTQVLTGASANTPAATSNAVGLQAAPTPVPPSEAKLGGTIRIGMVGDITALDPFVWSPNNSNTIGQVHDQLITYDEKFTPKPRLAESWELSADNRSIKFNLRKGVQYHNGRELTSDDIKYTLLKAQDPKTLNRATVGPGADYWNKIETPDKYTIILSSDVPRPGAFDSILYLRILDQELAESSEAGTRMNGTGPFKLVEWVSGDHITMAKAQNYWEPNLPYLDEVDIRVYADQSAMVVALEAGAIDMAFQPSLPDAVRLQSDPKWQVVNYNQLGQYFYLQLNTANPPMDNKLFRHAIAYAIDRPRFADSVMKGFAGPARDLPWGPASAAWEADKNSRYTFDLDKAKSLAAQAGISDAQFDLAFPLASFSGEYRALAQVIQQDLEQIGITATLRPTDIAKFTADGIGPKPLYSGARLNAAAFTNVSEPTSHFILSSTFGSAINASTFYDDAYKSMITATATEPDAAKRKQGYSQINDYLLDQAYCLVICGYPNILAQSANVRGLGYYPVLQWTLRSTWLA
ncbi:MAG: ABC transporter substrate-binding protein [Chloroflexi bacterium]|nr:ABC transporter substrate-binding protein [Chloroflexota bacterium]